MAWVTPRAIAQFLQALPILHREDCKPIEFFFFSANSGIPPSAIGNGVKEYEDGKDEFGENTHPLELYITEL